MQQPEKYNKLKSALGQFLFCMMLVIFASGLSVIWGRMTDGVSYDTWSGYKSYIWMVSEGGVKNPYLVDDIDYIWALWVYYLNDEPIIHGMKCSLSVYDLQHNPAFVSTQTVRAYLQNFDPTELRTARRKNTIINAQSIYSDDHGKHVMDYTTWLTNLEWKKGVVRHAGTDNQVTYESIESFYPTECVSYFKKRGGLDSDRFISFRAYPIFTFYENSRLYIDIMQDPETLVRFGGGITQYYSYRHQKLIEIDSNFIHYD